MSTNSKKRGQWSRRDAFRIGGLATAAGVMGTSSMSPLAAEPADTAFDLFGLAGRAAATPLALGEQIYESIGVSPFINAKNTNTIIGASMSRWISDTSCWNVCPSGTAWSTGWVKCRT